MFKDNMLKIYQAERVRIQAQLYELDLQKRQGEEQLIKLDGFISAIETFIKHEPPAAAVPEPAPDIPPPPPAKASKRKPA